MTTSKRRSQRRLGVDPRPRAHPRLRPVAMALTSDQFRSIKRAILVRGALVAAPVAVFASAYMAVWQPTFAGSSLAEQVLINVAESLGYLIVILVFGNLLLSRWLEPHKGWAVEGHPISQQDRDALVSLPGRAAGWIFSANVMTLVLGAIGNVLTDTATRETIGYVIFFLLLGFTFSAIVYLQTEGALRVLYARAFESTLPSRRTVEVLPRLVVSWAVGSAVPLVFVAILPLRPASRHDLPLVAPTLYMSIGGILIGGITAILAGRSVASPVESVRAGLQEVRDGRLDVAVEVTHPGALGALQAGFNDMVEAMRSRQRVHDLFGRHVGEDVARQALDGGVQFGGEVRSVAALFVDLIGSTELVEERPPSAVVALINAMFEVVVDEVASEGGLVNKFEGDGCLCVFGAPIGYNDHAARALRAARRLRVRLAEIGIDAAVGVSSGEAVAGNVGASSRFEYTVIGRPVNEAARLTDAAKLEPSRVLAAMCSVEGSGDEATNWIIHRSHNLRGIRDPVRTAVPVSMSSPPVTHAGPETDSS